MPLHMQHNAEWTTKTQRLHCIRGAELQHAWTHQHHFHIYIRRNDNGQTTANYLATSARFTLRVGCYGNFISFKAPHSINMEGFKDEQSAKPFGTNANGGHYANTHLLIQTMLRVRQRSTI